MGTYTIENFVPHPDSIFLEDSKKRYLIDTYQKGIEKRNSIRFEIYRNAIVLPVIKMQKNGRTYGKTGVLKSNGDYVENSSVDNLYGEGYIPETFQDSERSAAYLGCDHGAWGHFLINVISRIWIALEHDGEIDDYVIVRDMDSKDNTLSDNQLEFFHYLGISDKVRIVNSPIRYSKVIVPEVSYHPRKYMGKVTERGIFYDEFTKVFDIVSQRALQSYQNRPERSGDKAQKIFFSRMPETSKRQKDIGVDLINSFFVNNGYKVVYPEKISLAEMIYDLNHCGTVAYLSGTLQHNMLFAPDGMKAIAVERRIILSINQTDIDLIKKIEPTYVSAQYTILPGNRTLSSIYGYTSFLKNFISKSGMKPPDLRYIQKSYLKKCVVEFLGSHIWTYAWEDRQPSPYNLFYFEVLEENLKEAGTFVPELEKAERKHLKEAGWWKERFQNLLIQFGLPYCLWDENDLKRFAKTVSLLIEENLEKGRNQFMLYPYGVNGMIIENVLYQRYGIHPKAIFDNRMFKYHAKIKKLEEIQPYLSENVCVILTSCSIDCRKELMKYCGGDAIIGPYTVF